MDHKCTPLFLLLLLVPSVVPVPVIDVSALRRGRQDHDGRAEVVEAIRRACLETGFFYITGHGRGHAAGSHAAVGARVLLAPGRSEEG